MPDPAGPASVITDEAADRCRVSGLGRRHTGRRGVDAPLRCYSPAFLSFGRHAGNLGKDLVG